MLPELRSSDKRWAVFECRHVVPQNDQREHELWEICWCKPRIEEPDDQPGYIVIHSSADGREEADRVTSSRVTLI